MRAVALIFTDTNNNLLIPAIMQTHPGLRETLSYLDFSNVEIVQKNDFFTFKDTQEKYKSVVRVMIANPCDSAYATDLRVKFKTPHPDNFAERISKRFFVEKDVFSSYWIQTFTKQKRRRLTRFVDAPPMKFPNRSVNING